MMKPNTPPDSPTCGLKPHRTCRVKSETPQPEPQRGTLIPLCEALRKLLPGAEERISYRMPCFAVRGKAVAGFDGFGQHCSYFPHSGSVLAAVGELPAWVDRQGGTLRFPIGRRLPTSLVKRLIRVRLDELSAVRNGKRFEFYDDGTVKAEGPVKDGLLHGTWSWYRRDGSLLRTDRYRMGEPVGPPAVPPARRAGPAKPGRAAGPVLLAGGNPQVAKGDGGEPVQAYLDALDGWKHDVVAGLDELIARAVPGVRKAVRWNSPFYGAEAGGWFLGLHCLTRYVKVTFFAGTSLEPMPPVASKAAGARGVHLGERDRPDDERLLAWVRQAAALPGWTGF